MTVLRREVCEETPKYLTEQIITYIGNKRTLIKYIEEVVLDIKDTLGRDKLTSVDLFSGSGVVARMLKAHSSKLIVNDMEMYSRIINECYLTNVSDFPKKKYEVARKRLAKTIEKGLCQGIISKNYAPADDENIQEGERVFYTCENAATIDTVREFIDSLEDSLKKFFLAPLLYKASVHTNTSGVFKGFYKGTDGKGKYGGSGENALFRIKGKITIPEPILSRFECEYEIHQKDANELVKELEPVDVIYIDPPYDQHPYGSNYFMLNVIAKNAITSEVSKVSGIPEDWNRSLYNKKKYVIEVFDDLIKNANAAFVVISYNSEGFINLEEMIQILSKYGKLRTQQLKYNTFRGSRNLKERDIYVNEYIFVLDKRR